MGLNVYLKRKRWTSYDAGKTYSEDEECIFDGGTTHNLGKMASKAGIYEALWRPYRLKAEYNIPDGEHQAEYDFEDENPMYAKDIIITLERGVKDLEKRPKYFEKFNSPNGWGMYEHFVPFVKRYLEACKENPEAVIRVSR